MTEIFLLTVYTIHRKGGELLGLFSSYEQAERASLRYKKGREDDHPNFVIEKHTIDAETFSYFGLD
jgi:hypothetical protein